VNKIFKDEGVSGGKPAFERSGFSRMIEVAKLLDVKVLIFYDLTRLGRDLSDVVNTYRKLLEDGFTVLFVKHPELNVKPDSYVAEALRKAMLALLGIAAEMERAFIRERTRAGMKRAKEQGKHVGRPPIPFPKDKVITLLKQGKSIADT